MKRGRKGKQIQLAFKAITSRPQSVEKLCDKFGVSVCVLRQQKRFDVAAKGRVVTKMAGHHPNKELMIWREFD